jgi:hypothetical protein
VNSSRPGWAVGGKSKPSSYSRAASVEDCDTLSTPEVCDALSKREVLNHDSVFLDDADQENDGDDADHIEEGA